ncbi:uncharacterized protein LOC119602292 isoform X1 [Lucilia sericata]|uniref:uncharacterized protein LOC119602292 isoform X1 n=2 Tax=Lucilia sericata TaxID=13632 RepID=UPI0018A808A3|nr:uncharacterized protein LOC119602292 isoform X1 [Lucilia sericata]XP_037809651.1 uncharacterized protein LOC119602292 isoform X1 [Lucilia sericata]
MSDPAPFRRSNRDTKGVPPARYIMESQNEANNLHTPRSAAAPNIQTGTPRQPDALRQPHEVLQNEVNNSQTPKNTTPSNVQTGSCKKPPDASKQIAEIQREFQRQMTSLQSLIIANNNQTKATVGELRQEIQTIAKAIPPTTTPVSDNTPRNNGQETGESYSNLSFHSQNCQPTKSKKIYPLPKFEGQPEDWQMFYEDFIATTQEFEYTDLQNIIRIREALTGPARETVECLLSSSKNVSAIIETLKETFGRPEMLIKSQIQKVRLYPNVPDGKLDQLIGFANKVNNMATFLKSVEGEHHLYNPSLLSELVSKLSTTKQMQWAEKCLSLNKTANIIDFSNWLNCMRKLANMVSDSLPTSLQDSSNRKSYNQQPASQKTNKYAMLSMAHKPCFICDGECADICNCEKFLSMEVDDRWKIVKELHLCFCCLKPNHQLKSCYAKHVCGINNCPQKHHNLLHNISREMPTSSSTISSAVNCHVDCQLDNVLFQIIPIKLYNNGKEVSIYAFIDDGANATILDWDIARQLDLHGTTDTLKLQWLNGRSSSESTEIVDVYVSAIDDNKNKYEMKRIYLSKNLELPTQSIVKNQLTVNYPHLTNIPINEYISIRPKMIISIAHAFLTVPNEVIENPSYFGPIVIKCKLGLIIYGPVKNCDSKAKQVFCTNAVKNKTADEEIKDMMYNYFEVESCGVKSNIKTILSSEHERALDIMNTTTKFIGDRYECGLLWKTNDISFPPTYEMARKRLELTENKFKRDDVYAKKYCDKIEDLFKKGYARRLSQSEQAITPKAFYLPHFAVKNPNKDDIRVVFDAASKVHGISLNDALLSGPDLNNSLISVLFKFREAPVAVCGDIREMFLQVAIKNDDINSQRFLWRGLDCNDSIQHCVMTRMIFGAACSPTIAQFIKNKNAQTFSEVSPRAEDAIIYRHYVDDYVDCFQSDSEAIEVVTENVIDAFHGSNVRSVDVSTDGVERILGLHWNPITDEFVFILKFHRITEDIIELRRKPTKREMLSVIMSIFDPYGFLANITVAGKILMQTLWKYDLNWDDEIPDCLNGRWVAWLCEIKKVKDYKISRCHFYNFCNTVNELHLFSDASEQAMAVVGYWRIKTNTGYKISFVCGKTNCAPTRYHSIPKLELQAAVIAVRLQNQIINHYCVKPDRVQFWTDSHTVMRWIKSDSRKYKQYVANRVGEILEATTVDNWRWLPGTENPADDATRSKPKFEFDSRWKNGPEFLYLPENLWPSMNDTSYHLEPELELRNKYVLTSVVCSPLFDFNRYSNFRRLKRAMAWIMRFINNSKISENNGRIKGELSVEEEDHAEKILCRMVQQSTFRSEYKCLQMNKPIEARSDLKTLCPYLDDFGLLRVYGRIDNAPFVAMGTKRPCILPRKHRFTELLVSWYHHRFNHINVNTVICEIRHKFWIPSIRSVINKVQTKCCICKIRKSKPSQPIMGPLPIDRVTPFLRPFSYTGLDYFGPVEVTIRRQREKRWIALFTCLTVRAVHLEIATNLSSDACLMCIRNFANRRGVPIQIRSDNGTNFVGLQKELHGERNFWDNEVITAGLAPLGIKWKFNTPSDPSAGGAWERLVQSVKRALYAMLKEHAPRLETLYSLLVETENMVNSRPLTHIPITPNEPEPLTPNHFIVGCTSSTQTPAEYEHRICASRKQWRILQNLKNGVWKRWIKEYLPELTRRSKWFAPSSPLCSGSLVLICDVNEPRSKWKRGRVLRLIFGKDGVARSADIRTSTGVLSRPINKLAVLDVADGCSESQPMKSIHGGGDVVEGNPV